MYEKGLDASVQREGIAGGNIAPNRCVRVDATTDGKLVQCGANELPVGVADKATHDQGTTNHADTGDEVTYFVGGIKGVTCGAAVANGQLVKSNASGSVVPVAGSGTEKVLGLAMSTTTAAGQICMVEINPFVRSSLTT